jgi:hypothetical protein
MIITARRSSRDKLSHHREHVGKSKMNLCWGKRKLIRTVRGFQTPTTAILMKINEEIEDTHKDSVEI